MRFLVVCLGLFFIAPAVHANDTVFAVTPLGIQFVKTDTIRMTKEVLSISPQKITVDYEFQNDTGTDVTLPVSFPMPPIGTGDYDNHDTFSDFTVMVNGELAPYKTLYHALMDDKDITKKVEEAGLPLDRFVETKDLHAKVLSKAKAERLYTDENPSQDVQAAYDLQRIYTWEQTFPAHTTIRISHSYKPSLGGNSSGTFHHPEKWRNQIPSIDTLPWTCYARPDLLTHRAGWETEKRDLDCIAQMEKTELRPGEYSVSYLDYILSTGANWQNGIEDFTLKIDGAAVIFAELDGEAHVGVGTLEIRKQNFHPQKELVVEFLGIDQPPIIPPMLEIPAR